MERANLFVADDLVGEILIRLPAKSIGRFRCVCKRWLSLSSNPKFIADHASRAPISGFFCSHRNHVFLDSRPYALPYPSDPVSIESSCNGLLLLRERLPRKRDRFLILNPVTGKSWPAIPPAHNIHHLDWATLHFDPSGSLEFKIVAFGSYHTIIVFSSQTQTWKTIDRRDKHPEYVINEGVCSKGRLLWENSRYINCLSWFDVESEKFGRLKRPRNKRKGYRLGGSEGNIHYIGYDDASSKEASFDVWQLMPDFLGWSKVCSVDGLNIVRGLRARPHLHWKPNIVYFHKGKEGEGDRLFFTISQDIFWYHIQNKTSMDVTRARPAGYSTLNSGVFPHTETLISLDQILKNVPSGSASALETSLFGIVHRDTIRVQVTRQFSLIGQLIPNWVSSLGGDAEFLHIDTVKLQIIRQYMDIGQTIPQWVWAMRADDVSTS